MNIDTTIPIASVYAKPFTAPEPLRPSTKAAMRVVMFPSKIAEKALLNPIFMADCTVLPVPSSSLIRSKMITLASTAIPIERIIPAIPGRVKVRPATFIMISTSIV